MTSEGILFDLYQNPNRDWWLKTIALKLALQEEWAGMERSPRTDWGCSCGTRNAFEWTICCACTNYRPAPQGYPLIAAWGHGVGIFFGPIRESLPVVVLKSVKQAEEFLKWRGFTE